MFSYFSIVSKIIDVPNLLFSKNPDKYWLQVMIVIGIIMFCILLYKRQNLKPYYEGFSQDGRFVMKQNNNIYDDFYVAIYDRLMMVDNRAQFELEQLIAMTEPSTKNSVFLEVGSGTGSLLQKLQDAGYEAFGLDKSRAMVDASLKKHPDIQVKCGDVHEPMIYDRGTFTHVICTGMTFYQLDQKMDFLRNCYYWIRPSGYLFLHLVDRDKFDTIIPGGKPPMFTAPQKYAKSRITDTIIDFIDFEYKASWKTVGKDSKSGSGSDEMILKETFTDELTQNVRQNEMTFFMEPLKTTLEMVRRAGFSIKGRADMSNLGDPYQYYYILERPQSK